MCNGLEYFDAYDFATFLALQATMFLQRQRLEQEKQWPFWYCPWCFCFISVIYLTLYFQSIIVDNVQFQLPAIEVLSKLPLVEREQKRPSINVLVLCPTRELANQVAAEANKLLKYHPSIGVQVVIGGTRLTQEQRRMQTNPCQVNSSTTLCRT